MKKNIKNQSSIVRVIISNYDEVNIKELKVIHEKKAFLDCFSINKMKVLDKDKTIYFQDVSQIIRENEAMNLAITYSEDGSFFVTSINKENKRRYRISGEYLRKSDSNRYKNSKQIIDRNDLKGITVTVKLEMMEHPAQHEEKYENRRREVTATERKLLSTEQQDIYSKITLEESNLIDSKKIYQVNRFLTYRSSFLMYFSFINNLFTQDKFHEIGKIEKETYPEISDQLNSILSQTITDKNSKIAEYNNNLPKGKKRIERYELPNNLFCEDVPKLVTLFGEMRHALMHYDFTTFNNLYLSKEVMLKENKLSDLLDLNIFNILNSVKDFKEVSKSLYLKKEDQFFILGRTKKAVTLHKVYWLLCERKNGFNAFINSLFVKEGREDKVFKEAINEDFKRRIQFLELALLTKKVDGKSLKSETISTMRTELLQKQMQLNCVQEAYIDDIHYCKAYKQEYVRHQQLCCQVNDLIQKGNHKNEITNINKMIALSKYKMKEITQRNALIRLEYKMKIVFNFLAKEFKMNSTQFMNRFDPDNIQKYESSKKEYLLYTLEPNLIFDLGKIEKHLSNDEMLDRLRDKSEKNNLFKFSLLIYLLLPKEIRGNYLGDLKKYYYDIKNFDKNENLYFFNNLRLFEKNMKKFDVFTYYLSSDNKMNEAINKFKKELKMEIVEDENARSRIDRVLISIIFRFYRNVFSCLNNLELNFLLYRVQNEKKSIKQIQDECRWRGEYNFEALCLTMTSDKNDSLDKIIKTRNAISHLNYEKLFSLNNIGKTFGISSVNNVIEEVLISMGNFNVLNNNIQNDFSMRKNQFEFKLRYDSLAELKDRNDDIQSKDIDLMMAQYHLTDMKSIAFFLDRSRKNLAAFLLVPDKDLIKDFLELDITIMSEKSKKYIKTKISLIDIKVNKNAVKAVINKELLRLEDKIVTDQIKIMKEAFAEAIK